MTAHLPHVVIIGGGFGGLAAARALRKAPIRVTLLDRRNHHLFQPLLYQVATAALSPATSRTRSARSWRKRPTPGPARPRSRRRRRGAPGRARRRRAALRLPDRRDRRDALATSATKTWAGLAPGLKTVEDALEIRRRVFLRLRGGRARGRPGAPARVADLRRRRRRSDRGRAGRRARRDRADHAGPRLPPDRSDHGPGPAGRGPGPGPADLRAQAVGGGPAPAREAPRPGPARHPGHRHRRARRDGEGRRRARADGEPERIGARTVLWAAGVAASPLARTLGAPLDRSGRVVVEPDLSIPEHPEVFVIGDLARMVSGGTEVPGVAQGALQSGRHVARLIAAEARPRARRRRGRRSTTATRDRWRRSGGPRRWSRWDGSSAAASSPG